MDDLQQKQGPELKLTIAITTRNRAEYIGRTLDSIIPQLTSETELLVLDGASTDRTPEVMGEYCARLPSLRYVRLTTNDGPDRDFDRSVTQSRGEYCWLMTDDDLLRDGAVQTVLAALAEQPSLLVVNAEVRNADLSKVIQKRRLRCTENRIYPRGEMDRLFAETAAYLSFIGAVVIRRAVWAGSDRQSYFGTWFIHMGVIFQQVLPDGAMLLAKPLVSIRYGNAKWRSQQFQLWLFRWPEFIWSFPLISARAKAAVVAREPWRSVGRLLFYRAKGAYTRAEYLEWIKPQTRSLRERFRGACVLLVPGALANFLALLACFASRDRCGLRILDLRSSPYYYRTWLRAPGGAADPR